MSRALKLAIAAMAAALLLAVGALVAMRAAVELAREKVVAAVGPGAELAALRVTTHTLEIDGLRIPAGADWPTSDALRAERAVITPALGSLLSGRLEIASIEVTRPYLSVLRSRDGRMHALPSLLEHPGAASRAPERPAQPSVAPPVRGVAIHELTLDGGELELFDATVGSRPWRIHLDRIQAAVLDGPKHDGPLALRGQFDGATQDLDLGVKQRGADLLALEPYLVRAANVQLAGGTLDLDLDAKVRSRKLRAPGRLVLAGLELAPGGDARARVLGVPRELLVQALAAHDGRIELSFTLEGDVDDPRFSLNEVFGTRIAVALAESLGISVGGLVEGVGGLGGKSLEQAGKAARGLGSALKDLIDRPRR
jgi:hypothetical protein